MDSSKIDNSGSNEDSDNLLKVDIPFNIAFKSKKDQ